LCVSVAPCGCCRAWPGQCLAVIGGLNQAVLSVTGQRLQAGVDRLQPQWAVLNVASHCLCLCLCIAGVRAEFSCTQGHISRRAVDQQQGCIESRAGSATGFYSQQGCISRRAVLAAGMISSRTVLAVGAYQRRGCICSRGVSAAGLYWM
jgi:hypothetical protein